MFEALLADRLRMLGPDHPDTLSDRHNFAYWRGRAGNRAATAMFEALLADQLRVLGPDHPDTLLTRHNLASWRRQARVPTGGRTAAAEPRGEQSTRPRGWRAMWRRKGRRDDAG